MGDTDYAVNLDTWRLEVAGRVRTPLSLTYHGSVWVKYINRVKLEPGTAQFSSK